MIRKSFKTLRKLSRFVRKEDGVASIEILFMLPAFFMLFMSAFEGGMLSTRHVMLERGVDLAVREVRIGRMRDPTQQELKTSICGYASIIEDCMDNLQLEMVIMDLRNWNDNTLTNNVACIDKEEDVQPAVRFTNGDNNQLMVLIVCSLFDPVSATSTWGRSPLAGKVNETDSNTVASGLIERSAGMYALVATSAFVMEPFK